jgi:hypothetical protein
VEITDSHGGSLDTIKIEIDSAIMLYSQAFDAWGNTFGGVQCTWTVSEELPAVEWGKDIPSVYYHPYVSEPVRGTLTATAGQDTSIADSALVFIGPQGAVHVLNPGDSKLDNKSADGRRSDRGCGTGILLALVPPVGFRVSRYCRRGKNRCGRVIGGE